MAAVANVAVNVDSRAANSKLRQLQAESKKTESSFGKLGKTVAKLGAILGAVGTAKFVFAKTAELETQRKSLEVLTGSAVKANKIIRELKAIGNVTPFESAELIETAKRLNAFGVATEDVVETTKRLADVSGATGAELSGLATAYGQVQAKGRLQGEELLQFQERGVALQQELRKMYKLSGEEFQDALSKGRIGAEAVEVAIKRLTDAGGKYADGAVAQSDTLNGKLSTLQDNLTNIAQALGSVISPVLKQIFDQANVTLTALNQLLASGRGGSFNRQIAAIQNNLLIGASTQAVDDVEKLMNQLSSQKNKIGIEQNISALSRLSYQLQKIRPEDPNAARAVALQRRIIARQRIEQAALAGLPAAPQVGTVTVPELLGSTKGGAKGRGAGARRGVAREQKDMSVAMLALLQKRRSIEFSLDEFGKADLDRRIELQRIMESNLLPLQQQNALEEANLQQQKAYNAEFKKRADALAEVVTAAEKLGADIAGQEIARQNRIIEQQAERMKQLYASIGDSITTGIVDSLSAAVDGTKSLAEVAQSTLRSVANILLKFGLSNVLGGLGGNDDRGVFSMLFGGRRAGGGPVSAGRPYMVGESGPEMFVPSGKGSIVANKDLGGGTVINITNNIAEGGAQTNARGEGQSAAAMNQLSKMMVAVIQREQRPGGVLSRR